MMNNHNEAGLSEVIGFILLLGLVAAAFSMWMVYVVPANGREAEIIQMDSVKERFTDYKISLDSLWINSNNQSNVPLSYVTLSTSINLGTGGGNTQVSGLFLPMLNPLASSAVISIQNTRESMNITYNSSVDNRTTSRQYWMNSLQYQTQNYYWIQQQYEYQDGGVFLSQENRTICRVSPPISLVNNSDISNTVDLTPIQIYGGGSIGGNGPVRVDTRLRALQQAHTQKKYWVNISVNVTDYSTAIMWRGIFDDARRNGGITNTSWYTLGNSSPSATPGRAFINISGPYSGFQKEDVTLTIRPVEYSVFLNNIAPMTF
ncbi:MAG: hypothetical protein WC295_04715 [Methanoregula sp.]|jgi:hypothetical protein